MATLDDFKPYVSPEVPGIDDITLENHIRLTINDFCEKSWIIQRGFTHEVDDGDQDEDLNDSILINIPGYVRDLRPVWISRLLVDGEEWGVQHIYLVNDTEDLDIVRDTDKKVFYFPSATTIRLAPFTGACRVFMQLVFKPTHTATTFDDVLLHDWVRGVAAGVKAELMVIPGKPWSNPQMATYYRQAFMKEIGEAKVKVSKDYSKGSKSVYPREFGDF